MSEATGILYVVGIGPGAQDHATPAALKAIAESQLVVGYSTYIKLVRHLLEGKEIIKTGMTEEIGRARAAILLAEGLLALPGEGDGLLLGEAPGHALERNPLQRQRHADAPAERAEHALRIGAAQFESTLERDFLALLDFSAEVVRYEVLTRTENYPDFAGSAR